MTFNKAARFALDHERSRLAALDMQDNGNRLLTWHLATFSAEDDEIMAARKAKPALMPNMGLVTALNFVSVAGTKDDAPYKSHVILNNKFAVACDGQITAGHPITEELECCPHLALLRAALAKTGDSLSIAELTSGQLSVTGDKLSAKIPCASFDAMPDAILTTPDPLCAKVDDRLKLAFAACGALVSESGEKAYMAGMLLAANDCTATNGKVLLQYWHGIDLPPGLFIPKIFASAVLKTKLALVGFGFTPGRSVTLYFENGAWIKTQLYDDKYPDCSKVTAPMVNAMPLPAPANLFEAIETVARFNAHGIARLVDGKVFTDTADFAVEGLSAACAFDADYTKMIAPYASNVDFRDSERGYFTGQHLRGVIMAVREHVEPVGVPVTDQNSAERARGGSDDEIPF